jgi:hypothetical protein
MVLRIGYRLDHDLRAYCQVNVTDLTGERLMSLRSSHSGDLLELQSGEGWIECRAEDLRLVSGEYALTLDIGSERGVADWLDCVPDALRIHAYLGDYLRGAELARGQGRFAQRSVWNSGRSAGDHGGRD